MNGQGWTLKTVVKYVLLQVPAIVLLIFALIFIQYWVAIPRWLFWGSIMLWVAKDIILFPFVWRAYQQGQLHEDNPMIGSRGIAKERLDPSGYVLVRGELWHAKLTERDVIVEEGRSIRVREIHGLTLLVQPDQGDEKNQRYQ